MHVNKFENYIEGDVTSIADRIYEQIYTAGYSLLASDIERIIYDVLRDYVAWGGALREFADSADDDSFLELNSTTQIYTDEWSIIRPVVMARCDLMQAKRMEGAQNLGVQPVGVSSGEAMQNYREAVELMKKEAFNTHPFSVDSVSDIEGQINKDNINRFNSIEINYNGWLK